MPQRAETEEKRDSQDGQPPDQSGQSDKTQEPEKKQKKDEPEKKGPPKAPLRQRVGNWAKTHPAATALILAGLVLVAIGAFFFWRYLQSYEATNDAQVDGHIHMVGSRIAGTVSHVYVENNQPVAEGQTLADLDPRDNQAALEHAQAALAQARAGLSAESPNIPITQTTQTTNVTTAQIGILNAQAEVAAAKHTEESAAANLKEAEAALANAIREEERYRPLAEKQEVSREQYDQRVTQARAQEALVESRRAAVQAAAREVAEREAALDQTRERARAAESNEPRQVEVQRFTVAGRRAAVQAAQAQLTQAGLNLSYCKILAPVAGIVGNRTVEPGQQVAPGQELLAITRIDDLWVTANFKETQIRNMRPGQSVTISVDALHRKFDGYVESLPGATGARYSLLPPENATGNYVKIVQRLPIRLRFKAGQQGAERLRPGMSVEPKVWVK